MPRPVYLYVRHVLVGFALSAAVVALLLGLEVDGLRHLMLGTDMGWLGGLMLAFNGSVFACVQFGISMMRMAEPGDQKPPRGTRLRTGSGLCQVPGWTWTEPR